MTRPDFTGAAWRKACGDGECCVEVTQVGTWIGVRGSEGTILQFGREAWITFVTQWVATSTGGI